MYDIALSAAACLRSGTRADIAWLVGASGIEVEDWSDAVMFTPGGGRIGSLLGGAADGLLGDRAGQGDTGRLLHGEIAQVDALIAGLPNGGDVSCLLVPAEQFPSELWELLDARAEICLVCEIEGDEVVSVIIGSDEDMDAAGDDVKRLRDSGVSGSTVAEDRVITFLHPVPRLVVVGDTRVALMLGPLARTMGWRAETVGDASSATGLIATLSPIDAVVVASHDLEIAGGALMAALDSGAGYIGSLGSRRMQENRADWLAYRGVTDLSRVHGPAGLDIGAETPGEIAVSILAEAISERTGAPVAGQV
jgi:xanthine dehydrogenase accessory factor